jgi:multiple sugar transport system permease protein
VFLNTWKLSLAVALAFSLLWFLQPTRSTLGKSNPGVIEISYMGPGGPIAAQMDDAVREFEKLSQQAHAKDPSQPIYHVISGQTASRDFTEDPTRFLVSVAGGMPPDVIYFDRYAVSEWASRGAFTPLDSYLESDRLRKRPNQIHEEDFYKPAWRETVYTNPLSGERHLYGIPNGMDNRALFYNKDLLKRSGYVDASGEAQPPRTWEELEAMAVKMTEKDEKGHPRTLGFVPNFGNSWLYLYGWMNGGEFMSRDGRTCTLNDPKIVGALTWMTKIYDTLGGAKDVNAFQSTFQGGDLDPFITGKIAMKIDGVWVLDGLSQYARHLNWGVTELPLPEAEKAKGRTTLSWMGGWCYAIPSSAKQKDGAWEFIRFMSTKRSIEIMCDSQRLTALSQGRTYMPGQHPNIKINEWVAQHYLYNNPAADPRLKAAMRVFNGLVPLSLFRPVTAVGQLLWNQQIDTMNDAIYHKLEPQESLDRGQRIVQRKLDTLLQPVKGLELKWSWFLVPYMALILLLVLAVYFWDTRLGLRQGAARLLKPWGGDRLLKMGGDVDGARSGHSHFFRSQWKDGWLLAAPWLVGFVVFTGGPILFSILISFCKYDILNPAHFTGLDNYVWMFSQDPLFWKSLWNTVYMVIGIPIGMAASLGIALLLNLKIKGMPVWRTFFYLPSIIPAVASSILWIWIFNPTGGLLNVALGSLGISGPNWLQDEHTSKISLIIMGLWGAGGGMVIWLAGLKGISEAYYEAASLDGAGSFKKFIHVTLPMLSPYIFFNLIMGFIGTFQIFTQAFILTKGGPVNSTLFYVYHLFNNAYRYLEMGYASSMAWFLFLIVFSLTLLQLKLSKRWVHYEGD